MFSKIKKFLYFPVAYYFRLFAQIQLGIWKPMIIVVTGSSGKTTLLHLIQSQLGNGARYSHNANSTYGIPFDILGLKRTNLVLSEWPYLLLAAPFKAFRKPYKEKLYIVEADCDRPKEGKFLGSLLKPEITLWLNVSKSHSMNFDYLINQGKFQTVDEAIAFEFGYFLEYCNKLAIINGDSDLINKQLSRARAKIEKVTKKNQFQKYQISNDQTEYKISGQSYHLKYLLPEDTFYALVMCINVMNYLNKKLDQSFNNFKLPPGRSSIFRGIKNTTIIDSSYNANLSSMEVILDMFEKIPAQNKWVVLGDMIEQGDEEQGEHEKLSDLISTKKLERVILVGPRVSKYTYPKLIQILDNKIKIEKFITPKEALNYLLKNIEGGETLLFKGARFLEGVIEHLLRDKKDVVNLCRREKVWEKRRGQWEL